MLPPECKHNSLPRIVYNCKNGNFQNSSDRAFYSQRRSSRAQKIVHLFHGKGFFIVFTKRMEFTCWKKDGRNSVAVFQNGGRRMGFSCWKKNGRNSVAVFKNGERDAHVNGDCYRTRVEIVDPSGAEVKLVGNGNLQTESQSSRDCKRQALILSLITLLDCFAVLLYVTVVLETQFVHQNFEKHVQATMSSGDQVSFQEVCLDCQRLVKNPYTQLGNDPVMEGLTMRKEGDVLKCCAEKYVQLPAMLKAVARRQDTLKDLFPAAYTDILKSSTVFAHMQMISESWNPIRGYSVVKFDTRNNEGLKQQSRGITVLEDGIVILKTGIYYIYSNVFFNVNEKEKTSSNQKWSSHVHRTRWNAKTGILLTYTHTRCHNCTRDLITSFTGGVFQLQSGDFIQIFLSDVGLVYFNNMSSYLGLVMLSR